MLLVTLALGKGFLPTTGGEAEQIPVYFSCHVTWNYPMLSPVIYYTGSSMCNEDIKSSSHNITSYWHMHDICMANCLIRLKIAEVVTQITLEKHHHEVSQCSNFLEIEL